VLQQFQPPLQRVGTQHRGQVPRRPRRDLQALQVWAGGEIHGSAEGLCSVPPRTVLGRRRGTVCSRLMIFLCYHSDFHKHHALPSHEPLSPRGYVSRVKATTGSRSVAYGAYPNMPCLLVKSTRCSAESMVFLVGTRNVVSAAVALIFQRWKTLRQTSAVLVTCVGASALCGHSCPISPKSPKCGWTQTPSS
jgi:hypothetical protein